MHHSFCWKIKIKPKSRNRRATLVNLKKKWESKHKFEKNNKIYMQAFYYIFFLRVRFFLFEWQNNFFLSFNTYIMSGRIMA